VSSFASQPVIYEALHKNAAAGKAKRETEKKGEESDSEDEFGSF